MGFVLCLRLDGEKRQGDAKRRRRDKLVHLLQRKAIRPLEPDNGNGSAPRAKTNARLRA
jgi:hypothetical protein